MFRYVCLLAVLSSFLGCTKDVGINPSLAYNDLALYDSCQNPSHVYYKNDSQTILPGNTGHGTFKLRFNRTAKSVLDNDGKLPAGFNFPNGSMIIKDIYSGANLNLYAYMYKKSGSWLWGEIKANKEILFSVNKNPAVCINCHSQTGNRDLVLSFYFY